MDLDIEGNAALVVASSAGLGRAAAVALAREGANVVVNGRHRETVDEAVETVDAAGVGDAVGHVADITDPDAPQGLVETTVDAFGGVDHLVTSAGGPESGRFVDLTDEAWYETYDLLVMSAVRLCREAAPHLRAGGGGSIVYVTSRAAKEAIEGNVLTGAVRMGVLGMAKTISRELAPEVRVNAVLPGPFETGRYRGLIEEKVDRGEYETYAEAREDRTARIPLGRLGDPMELGDTVAFLASPRAGFLTGETVVVDGGLTRATL